MSLQIHRGRRRILQGEDRGLEIRTPFVHGLQSTIGDNLRIGRAVRSGRIPGPQHQIQLSHPLAEPHVGHAVDQGRQVAVQ